MNLVYDLLTIFFVLNGLFWSLASHKDHCEIARFFKIKCVSHHIHILIGIISILIGICIKQRFYLHITYLNNF
tara:strand:+ start:3060 stop:3278 length:219 start_codon:yes stop_codon:yes gene_type:complete